MKYFFALMLCFQFFIPNSDAQKPATIKWGPDLKESRSSNLNRIVAEDETGVYALRWNTSYGTQKITVERYDKSLKLKKAAKIKLKQKGTDLSFEDIELINGELILFTSYKNRKKKKNFLFAQKISKKSLKLSGKMEIIAEVPEKKRNSAGDFQIDFSQDSSKVLVRGSIPYKRGEPEQYQLVVLDKNLNKIWKKNVTLPYPSREFAVTDRLVDNDGNAYVLGRLFKGDRGMFSRDNPDEFDYFVISYPKEGGKSKKVKFDLGNDKFIKDMTMYVMKGGDLVCSGLYSEKGTFSVKGTFYFRKNQESGEIYALNTKEFDFDFRSELLSDRGKKKTKKAEKKNDKRKEAELFQYSLKDFVRRSDGGAVLVAEQFYVRTTTSQTQNINGVWDQRIDYHYTYGDIIVVNINPDGSIAWANHIPKRQVTTNDGGYFSSYSFAVKGGAIYIMFNDNPKNFGQKLTGSRIPRFNGRRSEAALVVIKSDGSQKKYKMFNNKELGTLMRPKVYKQVDNDELIICTEWRRTIKLGRVKFN